MDAGVLELILFYLLSITATLWFIFDATKKHKIRFRFSFALLASLFWPVFFACYIWNDWRNNEP